MVPAGRPASGRSACSTAQRAGAGADTRSALVLDEVRAREEFARRIIDRPDQTEHRPAVFEPRVAAPVPDVASGPLGLCGRGAGGDAAAAAAVNSQ